MELTIVGVKELIIGLVVIGIIIVGIKWTHNPEIPPQEPPRKLITPQDFYDLQRRVDELEKRL